MGHGHSRLVVLCLTFTIQVLPLTTFNTLNTTVQVSTAVHCKHSEWFLARRLTYIPTLASSWLLVLHMTSRKRGREDKDLVDDLHQQANTPIAHGKCYQADTIVGGQSTLTEGLLTHGGTTLNLAGRLPKLVVLDLDKTASLINVLVSRKPGQLAVIYHSRTSTKRADRTRRIIFITSEYIAAPCTHQAVTCVQLLYGGILRGYKYIQSISNII